MPGKDASLRAALDQQARVILDLFEEAGFARVEPDILQPADVFLDRSGEDIRARTYVFTDPGGAELCLRPDLTVPTCRYYIEQGPQDLSETKYCYSGPAFRYQPGGMDGFHPREFDQIGLEHFGDADPDVADADILTLTVRAVRMSGLQHFRIKVNDLRLFTALLKSIDMPERWRQRLHHHFWRPQAFRETLARLSGAEPFDPIGSSAIAEKSLEGSLEHAASAVAAAVEDAGMPMVGDRTARDIAIRLRERLADRKETPLPKQSADLIERYVTVVGNPRDALHKIMNLVVRGGVSMSTPLAAFARRITLMHERGIDIGACRFEADFGRTLEYYTGFVFQLEVETPEGPVPIAGGGRYDSLLSDIGCRSDVPAVGCAIHTERLLAAVRDQDP